MLRDSFAAGWWSM